jgi:hypothetical protein
MGGAGLADTVSSALTMYLATKQSYGVIHVRTTIFLIVVTTTAAIGAAPSGEVPEIIRDTDFRSDVDDAVTPALLNAPADNGEEIVRIEDDGRGKNVMFRWHPANER